MEGELVEYKGCYQATTNIRRLRLLYSLKNRKFIKGYVSGSRTGGDIIYRLYPGRYLEFSYDYWNKADPPRKIKIRMILISGEGIKTLSQVTIEFYSDEFLSQFPPQVIDFFEARPPGYHIKPDLAPLFQKVYSEEEHDQLLKLVSTSTEIKEGEELE